MPTQQKLPTSVDLGISATASDTLQISYNAAGRLSEVDYPNGMTAAYGYDPATGTPLALEYTGTDANSNPSDLAAFAAANDIDGRVAGYTSPASTQQFTYDALGRLTKAQDTRANGCTTRTYGFSAASERTSTATYSPAAGDPSTGAGAGTCQTDTPADSRTSTYDSANRITNDGYSYDNLGRTLTVPAADTAGPGAGPLQAAYRANDMVKTMTQQIEVAAADGTTTTRTDGRNYALDPAGRIKTITSTANGTETSRTRYEYADDSDNPTTISTTTNGGQSWVSQRSVTIAGLGLIASVIENEATWQIANLHGDTVATVNGSPANGMASYAETDEYGAPVDGTQASRRYGYLGTHQRAAGTDTLGGIVLMGARLYNPHTGLFLSNDPVLGGNHNRYDYPSSPLSDLDITGKVRVTYWQSAWWNPVKYKWVRAKLSRSEVGWLAFGAGTALMVLGWIERVVPTRFKPVVWAVEFYTGYLVVTAGYIYNRGTCGTLTGGLVYRPLRGRWVAIPPTLWSRRCGT